MKKIFGFISFFAFMAATALFTACSDKGETAVPDEPDEPQITTPVFEPVTAYADAWDGTKRADVSYQLLIYSFADSNGDGIGDFNGIVSKLDYLDELGVSAIWLSPAHPAASYHGYDVMDYEALNADYGTEDDFRNLVEEAHRHGIKIYMDWVINHTSRNHPWFKEAIADENSEYRSYYVLSTDPRADIAAGNIAMIATEGAAGYDSDQWFASSGTADGKRLMYHSHFCTDWFADLNYGAAAECEKSPAFIAICDAAKKWIDLGVDGLRLDGAKHIYHNAASDENHIFWGKMYDELDAYFSSTGHTGKFYMVGEVFDDWEAAAPYFKGLPSIFDFGFWYRLKWAVQNSTGCYLANDIVKQFAAYKQYRSDFIASTKLTNHDENRVRSDFGNSVDKSKLAGAVLLTSGGHPYIYYGEELGYVGIKDGLGDEYVRNPMKWGDGSSTTTFIKQAHQLMDGVNDVAEQSADDSSILNVYRTFSQLRNSYPALAAGDMTPHPSFSGNAESYKSIAAWYMQSGSQKMLVMHNLSSSETSVSLSDNIDKAVGVLGKVSSAVDANKTTVKLGAWSSVVYLLK